MHSIDISQQIGKKLRLARVESELTQAEVSQKMHCSVRVIARMESGDREPSASEIFMLSEIYQKPITFFFGG